MTTRSEPRADAGLQDAAGNTAPSARPGPRSARPRAIAPRFDREAVRGALAIVQVRRLRQAVPLLCLALIVTTLTMAVAVWQPGAGGRQAIAPALLIGGMLVLLGARLALPCPTDGAQARRRTRLATGGALLLGATAGLWMMSAFRPDQGVAGLMAAPVTAITATVFAIGLSSVPRAAVAAMLLTTLPLVLRMVAGGQVTMVLLAALILLSILLQLWVVRVSHANLVRAFFFQQRLRQRADSDPLTGLANRRAFHRQLDRLLAQSQAGGPAAVVTMLDLDEFKETNDQHGHAVGDAVLRRAARRLQRCFPDALCVARLGGDEFALLHRGASDRRWRHQLSEQVDRTVLLDGLRLPLRISAGQATLTPGESADSLLRRADAALYEDKKARRPRWRIAS